MAYCKTCELELEDGMAECPLCGRPADGPEGGEAALAEEPPPFTFRKMDRPQKKLIWEIISLILVCSVAVTLLTDFIIAGRITWSEYPVAVCIVVFCYVSLFALWNQKSLVEMASACAASCVLLAVLDASTGGMDWVVRLGMPVLVSGNVIVAVLIGVIRTVKHKGINLLGYAFMGAGLFCLCIEGIVSFYVSGSVHLRWSLIAGTCVLPVSLLLFFVHYRLKKGRSLERVFHI